MTDVKEYNKKYYQKWAKDNKEKLKEKWRLYYSKNKKRMLSYSQIYRTKNYKLLKEKRDNIRITKPLKLDRKRNSEGYVIYNNLSKSCVVCKNKKDNMYLIRGKNINVRDRFMCPECNANRCRIYRKTQKGKERVSVAILKTISKYPEKQKARQFVYRNLMSGKIKRPNHCSLCNKSCKPQGHHNDYTKPLDIQWVCVGCHSQIHKKSI